MSDIASFFALDPLELAKRPEAMPAIIAYYRERRALYIAGVKASKKDKAPGEKKAPVNVSLDDLDLG